MQMLDFAAPNALRVKMLAAITACPNVLVDVALPLLITEHAQHVPLAKLAKTAVKAAPPARGVSVEHHAKLLHRKLSIGVLLQKIHELLTPIRFIYSSHLHAFQEI